MWYACRLLCLLEEVPQELCSWAGVMVGVTSGNLPGPALLVLGRAAVCVSSSEGYPIILMWQAFA